MAATTPVASVKTKLETLIALARLLEKVDASPVPVGAQQYRALVERLGRLLADDELPSAALKRILAHFPSAGELYENLNCAHAGLVLAPLDRAVEAERAATRAIARWRTAAA